MARDNDDWYASAARAGNIPLERYSEQDWDAWSVSGDGSPYTKILDNFEGLIRTMMKVLFSVWS